MLLIAGSANHTIFEVEQTLPPMIKKVTLCALIICVVNVLPSIAQINIQWASRYTSAGNNIDQATDLDRDTSGNVIVTGNSWNGTSFDIVTIKYDPVGNQLWLASFNGAANGYDNGRAVDVDDAGNVYVTGFTEGTGSNYNVITIKYDASGAQQWAVTYNGSASGYDEGYDIMTDNSGNVYVTGSAEVTSAASNYVTIKYNAAGVQQWATTYNNTGANPDQAYSMDMDAAGNVYVTGYSWGRYC